MLNCVVNFLPIQSCLRIPLAFFSEVMKKDVATVDCLLNLSTSPGLLRRTLIILGRSITGSGTLIL